MQITTKPEDLEKGMRRMLAESRNLYLSWLHLGKAMSIPITPLFDNPGLYITRLVRLKMQTWKR